MNISSLHFIIYCFNVTFIVESNYNFSKLFFQFLLGFLWEIYKFSYKRYSLFHIFSEISN